MQYQEQFIFTQNTTNGKEDRAKSPVRNRCKSWQIRLVRMWP